jgi:hypothetical protein
MKRIEVKLSLPIVAPLLDLMKVSSEVLRAQIAAPLTLDDVDAEFREEWRAELLMAQRDELHALMALFDRDFFTSGVVAFHAENAEISIRACSALRLRIRSHDLKNVEDEDLESGEVEIESLAEPLQKPFMCYVFLGTIQNLILQHLDTAILHGPASAYNAEERADEDAAENEGDELRG